MKLKIFFAVAALWLLAGIGCNGDAPDKTYRNLTLSVYEDEVREITPYTSTTARTMAVRSAEAPDNGSYQCLEDWEHWKPYMDRFETTVLDKLFDPENGIEGIYGPVETLDGFIENVNVHKMLLDELGETVEGEGEYTSTFSVLSIETREIEVPFFEETVTVDRIVKYVTGTGETEYIAFTIDEQRDAETLVAFATSDFDGPLQMVIYGTRDNATNMEIRVAIHLIYNPPSTDSFRGQFKWQGNRNENWFSVTQRTDAGQGNWQVLGGGSIAEDRGGMSFMARSKDCGNIWYYIENVTNEQIESETKPGDPIAFDTFPPDGSTEALKYITDNSTKFAGILSSYPTEVMTCDWCTDGE